MRFDALEAVLLIPLVAAVFLAVLPGYRLTARLNVLAALLTFLASASLFWVAPPSGDYLLVDDLNKVFIVLTTFVAFTTSVFSASYIGHEIEIGRLTPTSVRFYHAMYQVLDVRHEFGARGQQYRPDVGGDRSGHAHHRGDGRHLPHP